jgi:hypothetical protein
MFPPGTASAPVIPGRHVVQAQAGPGAPFGGPKTLRPPKERPPRGRQVDPSQVRVFSPAQQMLAPAAGLMPGAPLPTVSTFETGKDDGTSIPPDTAGAFSKTHAFNPLNNNIHSYELNNPHTPIATTTLNAFWSREGCFDPKVVYDPAIDRFFFASMSGANTPQSSLLIAVSSSGDPTQPWMTQSVVVDPAAQGNVWMDYPSLGLTSDKVTVQVNLFTIEPPGVINRFTGSTIYVFDKASLLSQQNIHLQRFVLTNQGASQTPAVSYDAHFADQYLMSSWGGQMNGAPGALAVWRITGSPAAGNAAITRIGFVNGTHTWDSSPLSPSLPRNPQSRKDWIVATIVCSVSFTVRVTCIAATPFACPRVALPRALPSNGGT